MNLVDRTIATLNLKSVRKLSELCKVSEKTITGWKKKLPSNGEVLLNLFLENHTLKKEVEKSKAFKKYLREYFDEDNEDLDKNIGEIS